MDEKFRSLFDDLNKLIVNVYGKKDENKNATFYWVMFIGVVNSIMISKKIFRKNSELATFLYNNFDIDFPEYIKKSRTQMIGRTNRFLLEHKNDYDILNNINTIYRFINEANSGEMDKSKWSDIIKSIKF
ncbi:hypothetical protein [Heliophilum fasciatum]|uniref:Uncharacterized protein n=1 Tax=Heliophilum fasciatum TaxID=35700 RepID=A0A4R2RAZ7_9FIRM|nr:hypothetical protein [Heliophilum fasciatum]MCW2279440.1 hypothetical protein [Heliophilum fasciatum]TCP59903.1 hypothetical protein EDD73_14514 [Heliophilum fasciatum]